MRIVMKSRETPRPRMVLATSENGRPEKILQAVEEVLCPKYLGRLGLEFPAPVGLRGEKLISRLSYLHESGGDHFTHTLVSDSGFSHDLVNSTLTSLGTAVLGSEGE